MWFGLELDLVSGFLVFVLGIVLVLGVRLLIAYLNAPKDIPAIDPKEVAFDRTAKWAMAVIGAIASAFAVSLVQFGDAVGMVAMFVGQHPLAVTNGLVAGLGAGAISGFLTLSPVQYLGIAFGLVGLTLVLVGVYE